jgi:hypothetical protein
MKSAEFESLPPQVKQNFYKHFELTQQAVQAETGPAGEPPRVSLQLRGAVGPTAGSEILTNSGVKNITPQTLLEPPLDTVVIDNKDKPNAEDQLGTDMRQFQQETMMRMMDQEMMDNQKLRFERERQAIRNE